MRLCKWIRLGCGFLAASLSAGAVRAATWFPLGPFGGSARSFAADPSNPRHVFLGTATGWIYDSDDGGEHWHRVAQISKRNDLVIDHILADKDNPKRLIVGAYTVDHLSDGGLFISEDYGKDWYAQAEMRGQSVRSLARSPSDPKHLVAGTLKGVFQSTDNGVHWKQISPADSTEIREVQSIAVDPIDPSVIYAGTWHLPWKTTDDGATWSNIKDGIIDDSDVFSIIVDPKDPKTVYASACSGIYKSTDAGALFRKVQGIPSSARRTRTLEQDPNNLNVVLAGTTEGLYRTEDAGAHWDRLTPSDVIVNDVYVDPADSKHVLIATDRGGVYRSEDAGATFVSSNDGFSARQVTAYARDAQRPDTVYVGVVNDKTTGGVFQSTDGGIHWQQQSDGLGGRDVFSLVSLTDGTLLAGTGHGIFRLQQGTNWADSSALEGKPLLAKGEAPLKGNVVLPAPTRLTSPSPEQHKPMNRKPSVLAKRKKTIQTGTKKAVRGKTHRPGARAPLERASAGRHPLSKHQGHYLTVANPRGRVHTSPQAADVPKRTTPKTPSKATEKAGEAVRPVADHVDAVVYALAKGGETLLAGTSSGLLRSDDQGEHWTALDALTMPEVHFVSVVNAATPGGQGRMMELAGSLQRLALSLDGGTTWDTVALPADLTQIGAAVIDGDGNLWVGGREGVWLSADYGATWKTLGNLFLTEVDSLYYDAGGKRLLVTSSTSPVAFSVTMGEHKVSYWDTGWKLRFVRPVGDHLVGATLFDGVVVQPQMVDSPIAAVGQGNK